MTRPRHVRSLRLAALATLARLTLAAALVSACASNPEDPCYRSPSQCSASSVTHKYVVTALHFPENASEGRTVGLDLDGDLEIDNDLGSIVPGLRQAADFDIGKILNDGIATGEVILLVEVTADDLDQASDVVGRVLSGKNPSIAPCEGESDTTCGRHLQPGTRFEVDRDALFDAAVLGDIEGGQFAGGPNAIQIEIDLEELAGVPAFVLDGEGVRAEARKSATGLSGVIGGGVRAAQIENAILPALIETAHGTCQPHEAPDVCCVPGSVGAQLIKQFDAEPFDCRLTELELKNNQLVSSMLAPTLDLLNDAGQFAVGGDGRLDSMSIGARFEAIPADF